MRISDWSSDVCSSDLEGMVVAVGRAGGAIDELVAARHRGAGPKMHAVAIDVRDGLGAGRLDVEQVERPEAVRAAPVTALVPDVSPREHPSVVSEERRVGTEGRSKGSTRGAPDDEKK